MATVSRISFILLLVVICVQATTIKPDTDSHEHEHDEPHEHPAPTLSGKCPDFPGFASLNNSKLLGEWYVVQCGKDGVEMTEEYGRCAKMNIETVTPDGEMIGSFTVWKGDERKSHSSTNSPVAGQPGKFSVTNEKHKNNQTAILTILDTDYTNYGTGIVCVTDGDKHSLFTDIISRQKTLDKDLLQKAKASFAAANITIDLTAVDQSCP